jgi:hypothetical protein
MLIASGLLSYFAALRESPTADEPLHATAGYMIRWLGDYRLDVEDPALFTWLSTLPQTSSDLHISPNDPRLVPLLENHPQQWSMVVGALFRTLRPDGASVYNGVEYIQRSRIVFIGINLILGAVIAWWAYRLGGMSAAVVATGLFAFDPNFMAHGALVKNDVAITLITIWLMCSIWLLGQRATWGRIISIAIACACGVNVKFSGLFLGIVLIVMLAIRAIDAKPWPILGRSLEKRASRILFATTLCVAVGLFCWASIWTVYGWRFSVAPDALVVFDPAPFELGAKMHNLKDLSETTTAQIQSLPTPLTAKIFFWLDDHRLLPDAWIYGFLYTYSTMFRNAFLMGRISLLGWWYYFPLAILFKTPLAVITVIIVLAARWVTQLARSKRLAMPSLDSICLWLPIILYGGMALRSHLNIGLRHIFPIYPFIFLLIATNLARMKRGTWIGAAVVILAAVESLAAWPHQLAFFNLAAGRTQGGVRLLSDSNFDWGQDLPLLADWQEKHSGTRLYLSYFGSTDPHMYGIDYVDVAGGYPFSDMPVMPMNLPGVYAISATFLQGTYATPDVMPRLDYLKTRQPTDVLGGTIYLYEWKPDDFAAWLGGRGKP